MEEYKCNNCQQSFGSVDALSMHSGTKHPQQHKDTQQHKLPLLTYQQVKKIGSWILIISIVGLVLWTFMGGWNSDSSSSSLAISLSSEQAQKIPSGAIHWHPMLNIIIDGKQISIPSDLGYGTGKIIDTHLSGMLMSPTHTHGRDGTIHLENNNPSSKPETVTLGYLFYVWGKTFNSTCIFEYCTDKGTLKLTVNGQENTEFERYLMYDKDLIKIEYRSSSGAN